MIPLVIVDDDPDMLHLMKLTFSDSGDYEVIACPDARDALDVLKQRAVSVIISDFKMPVMNGGEFVKVARDMGYSGLFIIYSGRGKDQLIKKAYHDGADFYISRSGDFNKECSSLKKIISDRHPSLMKS
ncbi:MAG: response regulator [Methanoregula sp.]|nr:response regulator [Methanoregula sp.]